jgi:ribosomal silencing factor RsfS
LDERLEAVGAEVYGTEGEAESGWILVDAGDAIVHLFSPDKRELYALEMLWGSCDKLDWAEKQPFVTEDGSRQD